MFVQANIIIIEPSTWQPL